MSSFTKSQSMAVRHQDGPLMVLAGPGSGKTTVVTKRVQYMVQEYEIQRPEDFLQFVPLELENGFTSREFAAAAHIPLSLAQIVLNILHYMGTVIRTGKKGQHYLYEIEEQ